MTKEKQVLLNRMRACAQIILTTIRVGENTKVSPNEYLSAQNAIDAFFVLWKHENQTFSDELKEEVHLKLNHVCQKQAKRKDVFDYSRMEKLFDLILKETESPRKYRGLVFYITVSILHHPKMLQIDVL